MAQTKQNLFEILGEVVFVNINGSQWCVDAYRRIHQDFSRFNEAYQIYIETFLPNYDHPYIYFHSMGNSYALEGLRLRQEHIDICNQVGLEIYFSELLTSSVGDRFDFYPISLHDVEILDQKIVFEWENHCNDKMFCFELESVKKFIKNNALNNVTICVGVKDQYNILAQQYPDLKIIYRDVFLQSIVGQLIKYKIPENCSAAESIRHNFWCGNLRYMTYRHLISSYLANYNSRISFGHRGSMEKLEELIWFDLAGWQKQHPEKYSKIITGISQLNKKPPHIDKKFYNTPEVTGLVSDYINYPDYDQDHAFPIYYTHAVPELYLHTFCAVVTESVFAQPLTTVSEKPLNAIQNFRPFVLVGPPGELAMLKDLGFKTFCDFWDESYDTETDHQARLLKILDLLDNIGRMSVKECQAMYTAMSSILTHNYKNINQNLFDKLSKTT